jgi:hypothetical protein
MGDFEHTRRHAEGTVRPPLQRQPTSPQVNRRTARPLPQPRRPVAARDPLRFDVYGNPLGGDQPALVMQHSTYTSGRALASMVLGLLSLVVGGPVFGVPAMILSSSAERQIARSYGKIGGGSSARIGFWAGLAGSLLGVFTFYLMLGLFGFSVSVPLPGR